MKFGLNMVPVHPDQLATLAMRAEELGFESLWVGEHVIVPYEPSSGHPGGVVLILNASAGCRP